MFIAIKIYIYYYSLIMKKKSLIKNILYIVIHMKKL